MGLNKTLSYGRLLWVVVFCLVAVGLIALGVLYYKDEFYYLLDEKYRAWEITTGIFLLVMLSTGAAYIFYRNSHRAERKRAEEALRASEELLSLFIKRSPIFAFIKAVTPAESRVLMASENYQDMIGIPGSEMAGKTMAELFPAEHAAKFTADDWAVVANGEVLRLDEDFNGRNYATIKFPIVQGKKTIVAGYTIDITERKRAEERLSESEERLRLVTDNARDMLWIMDIGLRITWISPSVVRARGYTLAELAELPLYRQLTPKSLARMMELLAVHITPERLADPCAEVVMSGEFEFYRKDGSTFWADSVIALLRDKDRKPSGFLSVSRDITVRKRSEEALLFEKQKFLTLLENAPFGMLLISQSGTINYSNRQFREIFDYEPEDIPDGRTWFRKAYPDAAYRHEVISAWKNDFGESIIAEKRPRVFKAICKDGSTKIINFITVMLPAGDYLMACEDITERKQTEDALRESEERYRIAIEAANDGVAIVQNDIHVYVNQKFLNIFGYDTLNEIVGRQRNYIVHPDYHEQVSGYAIARQKGDYAPARYEFKGIKKDGTLVDIEVSVNTILHKGEKAILAYLRDITDRKRAEEALNGSK